MQDGRYDDDDFDYEEMKNLRSKVLFFNLPATLPEHYLSAHTNLLYLYFTGTEAS